MLLRLTAVKAWGLGLGAWGLGLGGGEGLVTVCCKCLHPLLHKSLTRKQATMKKKKKTDISREQHSKQANNRQGKL